MRNNKLIKSILVIASTVVYLLSPLTAMAATETITPTAWQAPPSNWIDAINTVPNTPSNSQSIAYRNSPGTVFNPNLNAPRPVRNSAPQDGSTAEIAYIPVSLNKICPADTPVAVKVGGYTRKLTASTAAIDDYVVVSGIYDLLVWPPFNIEADALFSTGNAEQSYLSTTDQTYNTTYGNLPNVAALVSTEVVSVYGQNPTSQGKFTIGVPPEITLTYDDALCTTAPTISNASVTIVSSNTASGAVVVQGSSLNAQDPDGDTLTYSITAGNDAGYFAINSANGNITTTRANVPAGTYTLTVQVSDGKGGTATATVTITVTESGAVLASTGDNPSLALLASLGLILSSMTGVYALRRHNNKSKLS